MTIVRPRAAASLRESVTFRMIAEVKSPTGKMTVVAFSHDRIIAPHLGKALSSAWEFPLCHPELVEGPPLSSSLSGCPSP
jgi:hypothetical protein